MNQKELKELIEFLIEKDIAEFELERGDVKVKIKRAAEVPAVVVPETRYVAAPPASGVPGSAVLASATISKPASSAPAPAPESEEDLHIVHSPIVGTFYEAP